MGIRVDEEALAYQLKKRGCEERAEMPFQKAIIDKELAKLRNGTGIIITNPETLIQPGLLEKLKRFENTENGLTKR